MTQAKRVHSTPPTNTSSIPTTPPEAFARAFRDLESGVNDLERWGEIARQHVTTWLEDNGRDLPRSGSLAACVVDHLADLLTKFKKEYYAAWNDAPGREVS